MKAVIPCALKEDSLFPMIESKPTALMPVMGKPLIKHLVSDLQDLGVDDIYLVSNYMEDEIRSRFEKYTNVNIITQEDLNGSGGAVEQCDFIEEDFLVVNGDVAISKNDIQRLQQKHRKKDSSATVLAEVENKPEKFGVLSIQDDRIVEIAEKPEEAENTLINTGIYVFSPDIFEYLSDIDGKKEMTEAVQSLTEEKMARFELVEDYWIDIGSPKKLWKADRTIRDYEINSTEIDDEAKVHENVNIIGDALVMEGAELKPGTVIEGKTFIGEDATVGPNTTIRDTTICERTQIKSSDIERSLIFEDNVIDSSVHLEQVVVGEECDIKSNTTIRESFIGPRSFVDMNNSIRGVKFVPDARTDLGEISK